MTAETQYESPQADVSDPIVVVGAGAAGMGAAIAAARSGSKVLLVDSAEGPGGTVTSALIHTLGGIYDDRQQYLNDGVVCELAERLRRASSSTRPRKIGQTWCLNVCPEVYRTVVERWIAEETLIQPLFGARVTRVITDCGMAEELEYRGLWGTQRVLLKAIIDATGTAEIVRMINPDLVYDDDDRAAGGMIFRLRDVNPGALKFPNGVILMQRMRTAAENAALPALCAHAWLDQGVFEDEVFVKLFVPLTNDWTQSGQWTLITREAQDAQACIIEYLGRLPEFAHARLVQTGVLGVRDGGRIKGEYYLTEDDVRCGRAFPDPACRCCWPIEYWHPRRGLELEYLRPGTRYEIPLRALKVKGLRNVWAAGKCLSADHRAQASARVVGQCWAMGQAVARAVVGIGSDRYGAKLL